MPNRRMVLCEAGIGTNLLVRARTSTRSEASTLPGVDVYEQSKGGGYWESDPARTLQQVDFRGRRFAADMMSTLAGRRRLRWELG